MLLDFSEAARLKRNLLREPSVEDGDGNIILSSTSGVSVEIQFFLPCHKKVSLRNVKREY